MGKKNGELSFENIQKNKNGNDLLLIKKNKYPHLYIYGIIIMTPNNKNQTK